MDSTVQVLDRAFDILELLAQSENPMSLTSIVKETGLSKATAHRLLQSLYARRYVEKNNKQMYSIGIKLYALVGNHINTLELLCESEPYLTAIKSELNLTIHLGVLQNTEIIYLEKKDFYQNSRLYAQIGFRTPAYCSSMGKCLLSCLSREELDATMAGYPFESFTKNTIKNLSELKEHLKKVRKQGWAIDNEEYLIGHRCVGAPIYDYRGDAIASLSASGSTSDINDERLPFIIEQVKESALQISKRLGYSG